MLSRLSVTSFGMGCSGRISQVTSERIAASTQRTGSGGTSGTEGQFFYNHHRWRGILKPSSVPLCVIQDMCLADIYKGREVFSEVRRFLVLWSTYTHFTQEYAAFVTWHS
jgi:hypothetical protein